MNNFLFDLQLFADEVNTEVATEPTEVTEQPQADSDKIDFDFGIDEHGDVFFNDPNIFGTEEVAPEEENTPTEQVPKAEEPQLFTVNVGGEEVQVTLDELRNGYMRTSDYTRKTQALAEERRQLAQMAQPQVVQPQMQNTQPQPQENTESIDQRTYYEKLTEFAKQEASKALGEEFNEFDPIHMAAFSDAVATVKAQVFEHRQAERARQEQVQAFQQLCAGYQQDPHFQEIDILAQQKLDTLPYSESVKIREAFDNLDLKTIHEYMTGVREEYYRSLNPTPYQAPQTQPQTKIPQVPKQRVNPPFVEQGGTGNTPNDDKAIKIDFGKLGKLTTDQQAQLFSKLGLSKL